MPSLGVPELLIIFLIIIVLFGSSRIAGIGKGLGEGIRNFKQGMKGADDETPHRSERIEDKTDTRNS
ncbi:MAG TPA: twin-arginine translocase TatA/TatE family subunit [Thermoanaerobaculia bacterium]|jgi:sec-independent protein translocase protein TatA|nr:twin-arginine translocase TatA/TatE family subunit [Thermoanaerobaculia bacterium]